MVCVEMPFEAVTNALSGLVGVGGLFVMGGGIIPETFPQWLGAGSVFLANLSECFRSLSRLRIGLGLSRQKILTHDL